MGKTEGKSVQDIKNKKIFFEEITPPQVVEQIICKISETFLAFLFLLAVHALLMYAKELNLLECKSEVLFLRTTT